MNRFSHVATLIAARRSGLDAESLAPAQGLLPRAGEPVWLDPGAAADIPFNPDPPCDQRAVADRLRALFGDRPIDVVVQKTAHRRKKLFLADMDSTMIGQECIDELADYVNLKSHVAAITERAMRGEIAFEPALRERVALLKGLKSTVVAEVIARRIKLTPGGPALIATMRANGAHTCLVSGGFTSFTAPIATMIGFDENRGNTLLLDGDAFSGKVQEPILGAEAKLATLRELRQRFALASEETLAIGDGANDLAMIVEAGLGVAYHAKPKVAAAADARIDHCDLTALLYAQGYRRDEFAAG
ncbi:MAG: phosphoserine phosphatase SerB [Pseudorhodoplanes sp.]